MRGSAISLIPLAGVLSQLSGIVLLTVLFASLRAHARRTSYFRFWTHAWLAALVAIVAVSLRWLPLPLPLAGGPPLAERPEDDLVVRALYVVHLAGKLAYFALLAIGAHVYARGRVGIPRRWLVYATCLGASLAAVVVSPTRDALMLWQCGVAIPALGYGWHLFRRLPPARRSWGSVALAVVFGGLAALWLLYALGFGARLWWSGGAGATPMRLLVELDAFVDSTFQILLGAAMVVLLMEDANRALADAHAELAAAHDRLRRSTLFDPLTGALNRRAFAERLGLERVFASFGSVAMLDLDDLKPTNDRYGHAVGDALLCQLVSVLAPGLRATDKVFRWGGDEFLVVLPGATPRDVSARLESLLARAEPLLVDGVGIPLRVSIGTAAYASAEELDDAVTRADAVMYASKTARKLGIAATAPAPAPGAAARPDAPARLTPAARRAV